MSHRFLVMQTHEIGDQKRIKTQQKEVTCSFSSSSHNWFSEVGLHDWKITDRGGRKVVLTSSNKVKLPLINMYNENIHKHRLTVCYLYIPWLMSNTKIWLSFILISYLMSNTCWILSHGWCLTSESLYMETYILWNENQGFHEVHDCNVLIRILITNHKNSRKRTHVQPRHKPLQLPQKEALKSPIMSIRSHTSFSFQEH